MINTPASGERAALRGYRWQYDQIAVRVYDALLDGDFEGLRLTDPEAGRVDDLVLIRHGRVDGYQFKSVEFGRNLTFRQALSDQRTSGGNVAPSLLRSLADGWKRLRHQGGDTHVHFVTTQIPSVHDHLGDPSRRPSHDHFGAFHNNVLVPLRLKELQVDDVSIGWQPALSKLHTESGLTTEEFNQFLQALNFDFAAGTDLPPSSPVRRADIASLSTRLLRRVSESRSVVELDHRELLTLMGWTDRHRLQSRHEFPIDVDTYQPLMDAIEQLNQSVEHHDSGYLAVIGPPGAGKSTLLSQALSGSTHRIVRYHAYVPGTAPARTRHTARAFLRDIVIMLAKGGVATQQRELPGTDIDQLRQQLVDALDVASREFSESGRRTIVVVDGLDHVDRDYSGNDGLLNELPRPEELPKGVQFLVGTRTLAPLNPYAQQQIEERSATIDLQHHRLSPRSILEICRRVPLTARLSPDMHQRIVDLSNGHPLALSYLFNRLRSENAESVEDALADVPAYAGDVAAEYRAVWHAIEEDKDVVDLLAVCARLRIAFTTKWLSSWVPIPAVRTFRRKLLYLFRQHHDGLRFFHDSFRQFVVDQTALGDDACPDERVNAEIHVQIAGLCSESDDSRISSEQLYHRYCASQGEAVLERAQLATFRDQWRLLRSPDLVREDITLALRTAAERADVRSMVRLLLALAETDERNSALEDVDVPGLLYDAGLTDEAIAWSGGEMRRVPLAHAYGLAASLGKSGDPAGRRIFDQIEHEGMDDPDRSRIAGEQHAAAMAWMRAAVLFRPLPSVVRAVRHLVAPGVSGGPHLAHTQAEQWRRYALLFEMLIDSLREDPSALEEIDSALADDAARLAECESQSGENGEADRSAHARNARLATVADLRVHARIAMIGAASSGDATEAHLNHVVSILNSGPHLYSTLLAAAEQFTSHGRTRFASQLLDRTPYSKAMTVSSLGVNGEPDAIDHRFRYWRLRYLHASSGYDIPVSIPPDASTPAGDHIKPSAPVHQDIEAIELAARVNSVTLSLAKLDAKRLAGSPVPPSDAWEIIAPTLEVFPPLGNQTSISCRGIAHRKHEVMEIVVATVCEHGRGLAHRMADHLVLRFRDEPEKWSPTLRLALADDFSRAGVPAPWYRETLAALETAAASQSVQSRLEEMSDLVHHYARYEDTGDARRIALRMIPMAFGVGYRKDYQFDTWVSWLGRALEAPAGNGFVDEAAWLARVLIAVDPMTEGEPRSAAIDLVVAVAPVNPVAAVRIFEYLVRNGTVDHVSALAALVGALVPREGVDAMEAVRLAADITAELLTRASRRTHSELAQSIVAAAERFEGTTCAKELAVSMATRANLFALPTTRAQWRRALSTEVPPTDVQADAGSKINSDEFGALVLTDGRRIPRHEVASHVRSVDDIVALRKAEARDSYFQWSDLVEQRTYSNDEVRALVDAFDDHSDRSFGVLASLARMAERSGARDTALSISSDILQNAPGQSWSRQYGGVRMRAAEVSARLLGFEGRIGSCRDLAHQVAENPGLASVLLPDLDVIVGTLDPDLRAAELWPEIRCYLDGMIETLALPSPEVLSDHRCRWWLPQEGGDQRKASEKCTPNVALAELAVGHISCPTWLIRDAATNIVVRGLRSANEEVARALARFAQPEASDDMLERAGRCLAAARAEDGFFVPNCLQPLDRILTNHPSRVVRDLGEHAEPRMLRALPPMYALTLPSRAIPFKESEAVTLDPYGSQYKILAKYLDLDLDTLLAIAGRYATEAAAVLPSNQAIQEALSNSHMEQMFLPNRQVASRAAFGRVLADLEDAGLLDRVPPWAHRLFRTVDVDVLNRVPEQRPDTLPAPPEAGHEQTIDRWRAEIDGRVREYIATSKDEDRLLIGASCRLTVLNWGLLEEEFACGTIVGADRSSCDQIFASARSMLLKDLGRTFSPTWPARGDSLIVENDSSGFCQPFADWLSFRPDLAAALKWVPHPTQPGCWLTHGGELAVETIWWVDGWWGRADRAFDDTVAEGYVVTATSAALHEINAAFGETIRHFILVRRGRERGSDATPVSVKQSCPIVLQNG